MSSKSSHVHRLKRVTARTGTKTYFCTLPDCSWRGAPEFQLGKRSICNRCGKEFILNKYSITLEKPHCEDCHVYKNQENERRANRRKVITPQAAIAVDLANSTLDELRERLNTQPQLATDVQEIELPAVEYKPLIDEDDLL